MNKKEIARLITLEQVVEFVEVLFDYQLPKGILFETPAEKKLIKTYRYFYKGLRVWLEHLVLKKRLEPEATFTNWKYYQPHAEIYDAYLVLAAGVHSRSFIYDFFDEPFHVWGSLMVHQCRQVINTSGLLGGNPIIHSKSEIFSHNLARTKQFDDGGITTIPPAENWSKSTLYWSESPVDHLTAVASDLAKNDLDFDEQHWIPYRRRVNFWRRKLKDCKHIQAGYILPNGDLFVTGKGKKIPKHLKGFAT